ncbi:MAG: lipopolysaccharide transport periplasmic protein LptA [Deltaproteobacteria bacterium]|nr:lipopolysaccharide transport periplasmic protein LptA [Deltaproteobacteria bacterium]
MNYSKFRSILGILIVVLILIYPSFASSEDLQTAAGKTGANGSMEISSNSFEIDDRQNIVTFTGDVNAKRDSFSISCEKLILYYRNEAKKGTPEKGKTSIDRITAMGEVKIRRVEGGLAMAEKAVYYQNEEKIILTGMPVVKQGDDFVEGSVITLLLKENRSIVEGSEEMKARAVLFPRTEKR